MDRRSDGVVEWWSTTRYDRCQLFRCGCAFGSDFWKQDRSADRQKRVANTAEIFVGQNRENESRALVAKDFVPRPDKNFRRGGVMRAVDYGAFVPALKTPPPPDQNGAMGNRAVVDADLGCANRCDRRRSVKFLKFTA